jgi:type IV secretory pathway TrbD component
MMQRDAGPESHVIHASLHREILIAGAEPAAVMIEVMTAGALLFGVGFHVSTFLLAGFYVTIVHAVMVWVAKHDAKMSRLYVRSLQGRDFYQAHASIHQTPPPAQAAIPKP